MPIPLTITLFDRGASGTPTTNNPVNLAGRAESYEDTLSDRYGFETARVAWTPTAQEIEEWARYDHLLRPMVAYSPDARQIWRGVLAEIEIGIGTKKIAFSLKDMANRLTVRFSEPGGAQGDSVAYSNTASQALFGIKDRVINASVALSAAASNQAQTILNAIAFPRSKQASSGGTTRGELSIALTFWGKYALLDWLLTASISTASTDTNTQIANLLASYAATNPFFSTSAANIAATGVSDTEYIEPDTTYREKIERLLARGNSAQQPLAWGFYDDDAFVVTPRASATPSTITYYESEASGQIRDGWQNVLDVWDVRPNAMAQIVDLIDAPTPGSIETPLRKYVARVTRSVRGHDVTVTLEPDDAESLESLLTSPAGAGPAGTSDRQAAFERKVTAPARSVFAGVDNDARYDRTAGVWKPRSGGTGKANTGTLDVPSDGTIDLDDGAILTGGGTISTGGGSILTGGGTIDTGGHDVSYPTSGTGVVGAGTIGRVAEWIGSGELQASTLIKSGAGVVTIDGASTLTLTLDSSTRLNGAGATSGDVLAWNGTAYAPVTLTPGTIGAPSGSGTAGRLAEWGTSTSLQDSTLIKSGAGVVTIAAASTLTLTLIGSATLDFSSPATGYVLTYDGTKYAPAALTVSTIGAAPNDATFIVQTPTSTLSAEQALSQLGTGLLKNTTSTGVLSIATASDLPNHASRHGNGGADEVALDTGQVTTGTFLPARLGSGTASSTRFLRGDSTWQLISTIAPADIGAAPNDATFIVQTPTSTLSAEQALSQLGTGILKNTTSTGVLSIAGAADLPAHASRHGNGGADEVSIDASQVTTGTFLAARLGSGTANSTKYLAGDLTWQTAPSGTVGGTGTAGRLMQWASGGADAETSTLLKTGAGVLTLAAASTYTLTVPASGTVILGTGVNQRVPIFNGTNSITSTNLFLFEPATGDLNIGGTITCQGGVAWDFGSYSASGDAPIVGYAVVNIAGSVRKLAIIA